MPRPHAVAVRWALGVLALLMLAVAAWTIAAIRPGDAVWEDSNTLLKGRFVAHPYPVLLVERDGGVECVLLVNAGKCGAGPEGYCGPLEPGQPAFAAMSDLDGRFVEATGLILRRDGRRMLELQSGAASIVADTRPAAPVAPIWSDEPATLRGRIVDPKCYMGAMKPGDGPQHRACAVRCIAGGVPPVLITDTDPPRYVLLADHTGKPAAFTPGFLAFVADRVEIRGRPGTLGDFDLLAADSLPARLR